MAKLTKIKDKRLKNPDQYRLRYTIYFPEGGRRDRSRRYRTNPTARAKHEIATVLEHRTRQLLQTPEEIRVWLHEDLISREDAERLDTSPLAARKTLREAMEEYRETWEISPAEVYTRNLRINTIEEILGADNPIAFFDYGHGERLKSELKARGLKVVTIRKYLQDLKRCFRHQVRLRVLPYNPFAELSAGRVPPSEKPKQVKLSSAQVDKILEKAEKRIRKEKGWPVLDGWLPVVLLMFFGTGLRRKEAMLARWEHIDWKERFLEVPAENTKDKETRQVGLGRRLYSELWDRRRDEGFILPRFHPDTVTHAIRDHFALCGYEMRLHDTRHTYTTLLQEDAGAAPHEAMQRTGHNDMTMLSRYTHSEFGEVLEDRLGFMRDDEEGQTKH